MKIEETIHDIAFRVGMEGLADYLGSHAPSGDAELDRLAEVAKKAIAAFEGKLEALMEEHDAEYG